MLYQIHENGTSKVVRFGSKGRSHLQTSYGPTKLELLGMVTAVLDCAPYIRGRHCVVECDHQALKPLFQKQLKGAIYKRWLAILKQIDNEIKYKPASEICVADALSRIPKFPIKLESSPEEEDPHFPYVKEHPKSVTLPNGHVYSHCFRPICSQILLKLPDVNMTPIRRRIFCYRYVKNVGDLCLPIAINRTIINKVYPRSSVVPTPSIRLQRLTVQAALLAIVKR